MNSIALILWGLLAVNSEAVSAGSPPPVAVKMVQKEKLRLVSWARGKAVGLAGTIVVTVTDTASRPVRLRNLEVHGLLFTTMDGSLSHVVIHSCQCVRDVHEPAAGIYALQPGQEKVILLNDWGCGGGMWKPPPPGTYRIEYRVVAAPDTLPGPAGREEPPDSLTGRLLRELTSPEFRDRAARSEPLEITLKAPKRRR